MMEMEGGGEFAPSKLGTKDHWDEVYEKEYQAYQECGDVGEVWFGYDSMERVLDWLDDQTQISKDAAVLDLGCGNGVMLIELAERGFTNLTGVDYSEGAIELAKSIAKDKKLIITYGKADLISDERNAVMESKYDVILDKGTYDAISLNPDMPKTCQNKYTERVNSLLSENGLFILTSCNWTEEELISQFTQEKGFLHHGKIKTPSFQFGGQTGSREACVIFKKTLS